MITFAKTEYYKRWIINNSIVILSLEKRLEILSQTHFADLRDLPIHYEKDVKDLILTIFRAEVIIKKI